jgi:NitT/TauT family transport system substrate-binding protein
LSNTLTASRRAFLHQLAAASTLALPALAARAATPLVVGYTAVPDFGAAFIAKEKGYFASRGLDVTLQAISLTSTVPAALVSNSIQIGGTTPPVFLQAADGGLDLVAVATGSTSMQAMNPVGVVAKNGGAVKTAADLAGRKLAVPGLNGTLHVLARRWLKLQGVDPAKVTFVEVQMPQIPSVLSSGSVDAAVAAEPFVGRMVSGNIGFVIPGLSQALPDGAATVLFAATRQWATSNAGLIKSFREALAEAVAFAQTDRAAALAAIGVYFKVPPPVLQATPFPQLQSGVSDAHLRFWADTMRDQDMLKKPPTVSSLILR